MTSDVIARGHPRLYLRRMNLVAKDGTKLFVRDWGTGEPVLFVASAGVSSDIWTHTIPAFIDAGYRCISFDRRGHGRSDDARAFDMDTLASDIACVVERLELRDVTVIGHSLGGAEAIRYCSRGPGKTRVKSLVLLAPTAPFMRKTADNPDGIEPALVEAGWATWRRDFPAWVRASARPFFDEGTSAAMMDWGVSLLTATPLFVHLALGRVVVETDLRDDLAKLDVPTLLLHGEKDVSVPIAFGRRTAQMIRGCRFKAYPDGAHGLFVTHVDEVNRDIFAFLRETTQNV